MGAGSSGCRVRTHPKQAVALVTLQPPAVFFIHREQRKPIPTAVIPYPAAARRSCRPTWLFPPDFFFLRAKKPRRHAERSAARKNSMTKKPIFRKPPCQNRKPVVCYGQGAGHPVVGCVHTLLVCCAGNTADRLLFYNTILA